VITRRHVLAALAASFGSSSTTLLAAPQRTTLLVSHPSGLAHDMGAGYLDRPERLRAAFQALAQPRFERLTRVDAPLASREAILRVHAPALFQQLQTAAPKEGFAKLGPDTVMNVGTLQAALRSAGGATRAVDAVFRAEAKNAFVAARPPGHHATANSSMGYCFLNNASIAARHAIAAHGAERVAIVDFDVHHGNGVQEIFWNEKNVLYCSTHQMPLYPGSGAASERGEYDNIVNAPLRKGDGGEQFRAALKEAILPRIDAFRPELIILCAGFDAHVHDPLGGLRLVEDDFREATLRIMEIAARRCEGRVVSLLEGGYNPADLAASIAAHVGALVEA
jgi:acetoin utilization deacetylase AcuC-like enzyme